MLMFIFLAVALALPVLVAGCGDGTTTTAASTAPQCDPKSPSIIPPPSGKPQLVEFFRDT
jgi:hypothetical protein